MRLNLFWVSWFTDRWSRIHIRAGRNKKMLCGAKISRNATQMGTELIRLQRIASGETGGACLHCLWAFPKVASK